MGLLDTPTEGQYRLNGHPADSLTVRERARLRNQAIGFIFQSFNLIGDLTVFENVELHADGATICMVTHDPRYLKYAQRTIHLFDGQVVDETDQAVQEAII